MRGLLIVFLLTAGCAATPEIRTERVEVPVDVVHTVDRPVLPPSDLYAPLLLPQGIWQPPLASGISACLAPDGEQALLALLTELLARQAALRAWATSVQTAP